MLGDEESVGSRRLLLAAVVGVADAPAAAAILEFWKPPYRA